MTIYYDATLLATEKLSPVYRAPARLPKLIADVFVAWFHVTAPDYLGFGYSDARMQRIRVHVRQNDIPLKA
jgi:pimeloyl-ACP methyl ester carboxylesterase